MSEIIVTAVTGRAFGGPETRRLRREDKIPAVIYGGSGESVALTLDRPVLRHALSTDAGNNVIVTVKYDGHSELAIIKEIQRDKVKRTVNHIDFLRVTPDQKITVKVPVVLTGEAPKVAAEFGMVEQVLNVLSINTTPATVPVNITVDVSPLEVGSFITVNDLVLTPGTTVNARAGAIVAAGRATRATAVAAAATAPVAKGKGKK